MAAHTTYHFGRAGTCGVDITVNVVGDQCGCVILSVTADGHIICTQIDIDRCITVVENIQIGGLQTVIDGQRRVPYHNTAHKVRVGFRRNIIEAAVDLTGGIADKRGSTFHIHIFVHNDLGIVGGETAFSAGHIASDVDSGITVGSNRGIVHVQLALGNQSHITLYGHIGVFHGQNAQLLSFYIAVDIHCAVIGIHHKVVVVIAFRLQRDITHHSEAAVGNRNSGFCGGHITIDGNDGIVINLHNGVVAVVQCCGGGADITDHIYDYVTANGECSAFVGGDIGADVDSTAIVATIDPHIGEIIAILRLDVVPFMRVSHQSSAAHIDIIGDLNIIVCIAVAGGGSPAGLHLVGIAGGVIGS